MWESCLWRNKNLFKAMEITFILCMFIAMLNRIQYGIDFSDESWYVAEPYAVAELGAEPFINNVMQAPGFTLPLALAFKLYVRLTGSTVGIVLFSRMFYLFVHLFISSLTVWIVNRYTMFKVPLWTVGALLVINHCYSLYDVSYNTIGMMYFPLIMALVFAEYEEDSWRSLAWGGGAGIVAARTVMGTPASVAGLLVVFLYLLIKKKRLRIVGILVGAGLVCILIFGRVAIDYGVKQISTWFLLFSKQVYFSIEIPKDWERILNLLLLFFRPAVLLVVGLSILRKVLKDHPMRFASLWRIVLAGSILIGVFISVRRNDYVGFHLMCYTWGLPYLYWHYSERKEKFWDNLLIISMAYLCIFFFAAFSDVYGFSGRRAYWNYVPLVLSVCVLARDTSFPKTVFCRIFAILCFVCTMCIVGWGVWKNYSFVYRDKPIRFLSAKVEDGIWKGLYTTEARAKNVVSLERYVKSITKVSEDVLCLDWVSFGYLMVNGKMCSPSTLDSAAYSYRVNIPHPYYLYFQAEKRVPDKIIYIDYGRDKHLSIDDGNWKFNELVWRHYHFTGAYRNELFYVRVYALDDQEEALRLVEEYLRKI